MTRISARQLEQLEGKARALWLRAYALHLGATEGYEPHEMEKAAEDVVQNWPLHALKDSLGEAHPWVRDMERRRLEHQAAEVGLSVEEVIQMEREARERLRAKDAERR